MARNYICVWLAAPVLSAGVATASFAEDACAQPPLAAQEGIAVDICRGAYCGVTGIVFEISGDDSELADIVVSDLTSSGLFFIVDPGRPVPYTPEPEMLVRLSTTRLDNGSTEVDVEVLDYLTREPLATPCLNG